MLERPPRASGRAETIVANLPPGCACMVCPRAEATSIRSYPAGLSAGARQPPDPPKDPSPREAVHPPPAELGRPGISPSTNLIMTMSHFLSMARSLTGEADPSAGVDISAIGEVRNGIPSTACAADSGRAISSPPHRASIRNTARRTQAAARRSDELDSRARAPRARARSAERCAWGRIESAGEQHAVRRSVAIESGGLCQRHENETRGNGSR